MDLIAFSAKNREILQLQNNSSWMSTTRGGVGAITKPRVEQDAN